MGVMVSEVYDAFVEAGASKDTARRAAESIPVNDQLATKQDIVELKAEIAEGRATVANEFKSLYRHLRLMAASIVAMVLALGKLVF